MKVRSTAVSFTPIDYAAGSMELADLVEQYGRLGR